MKEGSSVGLTNLQERPAAVASASVHGILGPLHGQTVVIKYGGAAMEKPGLRDLFSRDIALARTLGVAPGVVHGGGGQIDRVMNGPGTSPPLITSPPVTVDVTTG